MCYDVENGQVSSRLNTISDFQVHATTVLTNTDDAEDGDLIHTDDEEKADEDGFSIIAMWNWERKNYFIKE